MYEFPDCAQLIGRIHRAFANTADVRIETVVPCIPPDDWEVMALQAAFTNKAWPEITVDFLTRNEGYRGFLSVEALYLFLPAFMMESLKSEGIYAIAPGLMREFSPRPYGQIIENEISWLTREQCCVVYQYVEFLTREFADVFEDIQHSQNTLEYWKRQCEI